MMWSDRKIPGLEGFGIEVVERVPIPTRDRRAKGGCEPRRMRYAAYGDHDRGHPVRHGLRFAIVASRFNGLSSSR